MFLRFMLCAAVLVLSGVSHAGTHDPSTPDQKYIDFGKKFPFVVKVKAMQQLGENAVGAVGINTGSGVAIGSRWVLTAAHVFPEGNVNGGFIVLDGKPDAPIPLDIVVVHGGFSSKKIGWHDIALCHTAADIGLDFYPQPYTESNEKGSLCTMSGWGATGTFNTGFTKFDGIRRAGSNTISDVDKSVLICEPSRKNKTSLEFLICPGDSGGGLFIGNEVAGIVSYIMGPSSGKPPRAVYGDTAAFTRVSLYANWIKTHQALINAATGNISVLKKEPESK